MTIIISTTDDGTWLWKTIRHCLEDTQQVSQSVNLSISRRSPEGRLHHPGKRRFGCQARERRRGARASTEKHLLPATSLQPCALSTHNWYLLPRTMILSEHRLYLYLPSWFRHYRSLITPIFRATRTRNDVPRKGSVCTYLTACRKFQRESF